MLLALPENVSSRRPLLAAVGDVSLDVARAALRRLLRLAGPVEIAELRRRMLLVDIGLVGDVAAVLRKLNDPLATATATTALRYESPFVRHKAAVALRELGDPRARAALLRALDDSETPVRRVALEALTRLPDDAATVAACRLRLADRDASVRSAAVAAVARLDPEAAATLWPLASDRDGRVRAELGAVAGVLSAEALRMLLGDPEADVRARTLNGLVVHPRPELTPTVIATLADADWHVRRAACDAAAGDERASGALVRALVDPHPSVRGRALVALERLIGDALDQILEQQLSSSAAPLRRALVEILGRRGHTASLLRLVSDPSVDVRLALVHALAADDSDAARAALDYLRADDDLAVRHAVTTLLGADDDRQG